MKKILVCEDEAAIRDFVVINLTRAGYDVVEADCGEAALQKYEEHNGDFDVAILDVMMPGIDGIKLCQLIKRNDSYTGWKSNEIRHGDKINKIATMDN